MDNEYISMSAALSAAKKRRAPIAVETPKNSSILPQQQQQHQQQQVGGLTLQQVIALIDKRLTNLETVEANDNDTTGLEDMTEEYENRFDILAQEISELKQTVLSLQTYTMEVNKMLFDEKMAKQNSIDL
jgi:hypothetical protein